METEGLDEVDGFRLLKSMGHYKPKEEEEKINNIAQDRMPEYEDPDDEIFQLLWVTAVCMTWREGLWSLLTADTSESSVRKTLAFLHEIVHAGAKICKARNTDPDCSIEIVVTHAPTDMNCTDWMMVLKGLNFEVTSKKAVPSIDDVHVTVCPTTNTESLEGFCSLTRAMSGLSWTNLQTLLNLDEKYGRFLWEMLALLRGGGGMDQESRDRLCVIQEQYPYFVKSLGFQLRGHALQWEKPVSNESDCLYWSLHGLFRSTDTLESPL